MFSKIFIKNLVDSCPLMTAQGIADYLHDELKLIEEVRRGVFAYKANLSDECRRHEEKTKQLNAEFVKIRSQCKHWDRVYHPDPSGNNDSYYECTICGLNV